MKKTIKTAFSLLCAIVMVISLASTAYAADASVTFTGRSGGFEFSPGSEYTDTDLFPDLKNAMPGDSLTQTVTVTNTDTEFDYIKVYLRAQAHDETDNPLSENVAAAGETVASMTDFLAQLAMRVYNGTTLIYEGSPDELDGLQSNVLLGTLDSGESVTLKVELDVPISLGNEYANRVGEVDWVFTVEAFEKPTPPPEEYTHLTVRKLWDDNGVGRPDSVTVKLLCNGVETEQTQVLSNDNQWTYTWEQLDEDYTWSVEEIVPEAYTPQYSTTGNTTTITNTKNSPPVPDDEDITVVKVWEDDGIGRPSSVSVSLLRNGVTYDTQTLSDTNNWTHTWSGLDQSYDWSVVEDTVPEGYTASYSVSGGVVTVTNTKDEQPVYDVDLGVRKVWSDNGKDRPSSVSVTLYNGDVAVETVILGDWNSWSYTWRNLSSTGNWQVIEVNIPRGYTPSYSVRDGVVTITNTATLIQTGQLNWPVYALGGAGLLLVAFGFVIIVKQRKKGNA